MPTSRISQGVIAWHSPSKTGVNA